MQPTSPRRSSRARLVQPPTQVTHSNSTSSASSQRGERNTRSSIRQTSPHKTHIARSESSEEVSDIMRAQTADLPPRRSRRQHDHQEEAARAAEEEADEEGAEDEGTIRCICGSQDYPGPATDGLPDAQIDFVMCDSCKVWQHGGCVGIFDEGTNPDNYFCEECKPDLHQVAKGYTGQHYSHYLPVWEIQFPKGSLRKSSISKPTELRSKDKERNARLAAAAAESTKRRSTINSRANYDEEEVLRQVLEESKHEGPPTIEHGSRRGKRGREDSEDTKRDLKRQRTVSSTPSSLRSDSQTRETPSDRQPELKKMPSRSTLLKTTRESEARSKETERLDGALKKKRVPERGQTDSTPPDLIEQHTLEKTPQADPPASQPPDTPSSTANVTTAKRGAKTGTAKRGGRNARGVTHGNKDASTIENPSPTRKGRGTTNGTSKDTSSHEGAGSGGDGATNGTHHVGKRGRQPAVHRDPSMLELRKKAGAMAHYIRESEVEMARWSERGLAAAVAGFQERLKGPDGSGGLGDEAITLAAELSTKLVKWETEFGKWGEKA